MISKLAHNKVGVIHRDYNEYPPDATYQHADHGPAFQALWRKLRNEVRSLQRKGYYGDGKVVSGDIHSLLTA